MPVPSRTPPADPAAAPPPAPPAGRAPTRGRRLRRLAAQVGDAVRAAHRATVPF